MSISSHDKMKAIWPWFKRYTLLSFESKLHFLSRYIYKQEATERKNTQMFIVAKVQMTIMTAQV